MSIPSIFSACFHLSQDRNSHYIDAGNQENLDDVASAYSLAKYGSFKDLKFFAWKIYEMFQMEIKQHKGSIWNFFSPLEGSKDFVILMTPGYRNVKASGNIMFDLALPYINSLLTTYGFPVIANFKLLRPMNPCRDYATLPFEERGKMGFLTDHILPRLDFFCQGRFHVIYGDDIYITGSSSEKARKVSLDHGALSFLSVFAVMMDQNIAQQNPAIEEILNQAMITERLDESAFEVYRQPQMQPVLRSIELLLCDKNTENLESFLHKIPVEISSRIYLMFMGNESLHETPFAKALSILRCFLEQKGVVDMEGFPIWR